MVNKQVPQTTHTYLPPTSEDLLGEYTRNHRSYQEFLSKGLDKIYIGVDRLGQPLSAINKILDSGLFRRTLRFLSLVDIAKGPIERRVDRLERRRDLDPDTHRMVEHLVVHSMWIAKDFNGNEIIGLDILEGAYNYPRVMTKLESGKRITTYDSWEARYDIPFTKEAVDKALEGNLNPPEMINYFVRVSRTQRDGNYSFEQFRDTTFDEAITISKENKGLIR